MHGLDIGGSKKHGKGLLMSSNEIAIRVTNLSKCYEVYDTPRDRLKQFFMPRVRRIIDRVDKQYFRKFWALKNVTFEVKKGETVGIIGRNGSGKSTLLQIICGTLHPSDGTVETNGRIAALLELGSGFNPEFTGRENIYMNASVLGLSTEEIDEKFNDIVSFADIGNFIEQPVKTYSSGMVVRLAFAVIAHVDANILVIDEALSVGDVFFVQKCMRYLRQFMETGTVLFVSHDTGAVLNLCQKAIFLQEGVIAENGHPKEVTECYLEKLYESQQGECLAQNSLNNTNQSVNKDKPARDMRLDFINQTTLRNDIELFPFSSDASNFGKGGAKITHIQLLDTNNNSLSWVVGGEHVKLIIHCVAQEVLHNPIVGFQIKDRLGQIVFADNTYLSYMTSPLSISAAEYFAGSFEFYMPILQVGDYTISPAIAEGTQDDHIQHQWIHDAITFKVHSTSVRLGIIGLPMLNIELIKL